MDISGGTYYTPVYSPSVLDTNWKKVVGYNEMDISGSVYYTPVYSPSVLDTNWKKVVGYNEMDVSGSVYYTPVYSSGSLDITAKWLSGYTECDLSGSTYYNPVYTSNPANAILSLDTITAPSPIDPNTSVTYISDISGSIHALPLLSTQQGFSKTIISTVAGNTTVTGTFLRDGSVYTNIQFNDAGSSVILNNNTIEWIIVSISSSILLS